MGEADRLIDFRTRAAPRGVAFFCPSCGRIWATAQVVGEKWYSVAASCANCDAIDILNVPGSLWIQLNKDFNEALPREILLREFDLALKYNEHLETLGWNSRTSVSDSIGGPLGSSAMSDTSAKWPSPLSQLALLPDT